MAPDHLTENDKAFLRRLGIKPWACKCCPKLKTEG
jgi:hypothetical protein